MRFVPRALTPAQERAVRFAASCGADLGELAGGYGVHVRTIRRTIERPDAVTVDVQVAGYVATFEVDELGPIQRTDWVAA